MKIEKLTDNGTTTLTLEGWLDTQAAPELENALKEVPPETKSLILDCEKLEYISSSGIRQIVAAHKLLNGNLTLKNVSAEIMSVLNMTGVSSRVNIA